MLIGQLLLWGWNCLLFHVVNDLDSHLSNTYRYVVKYLIVTLIFVFIFSFNIEINEYA